MNESTGNRIYFAFIAIICLILVLTILTVSALGESPKKQDDLNWNNGICSKCGNQYSFKCVTSHFIYYFECDNCKNIIQLHSNPKINN